jgi:hypothetical protein
VHSVVLKEPIVKKDPKSQKIPPGFLNKRS